ncbi:MAG: sensor domain-containing diguanylate cyclase [Gemmatimonadetes bacterium]|nr:sensor domain-containing diguanylate cyclase [Gemmatimonadota bacterium]
MAPEPEPSAATAAADVAAPTPAVTPRGSALAGWLLGVVSAAAAGYWLIPEGTTRSVFGNAVLVAGPLAAALAFLAAARVAPRGRRAPWAAFAAGAASAVAGQITWIVQQMTAPAGQAALAPSFFLFLLFHALLATGAILALRPVRVRGSVTDLALDTSLILLASAVILLRFVLEPLLEATPPIGRGAFVALLAGPLASIGSLFFAALLLVWRGGALPGQAVVALAGGSAVLAAANGLMAAGADPDPARAGDAFELLWVGGWAVLAAAGFVGWRERDRTAVLPPGSRLAAALARALVPGVALLLGAVGLDAAARGATRLETDFTLGVLGLVLAVRIARALRGAEQEAEERRQLEQTRTLVEVSHALAGSTETSRTLQLVVDWACRFLSARASGIELLSADGETLELRAVAGLPPGVVGMSFPVDGSFTGWVVRHGRPRITLDPAGDPYIRPESLGFLPRSPTAAVALLSRDRMLGALFCCRERPFDAEDLRLLEALADQAALAIQNVRLFEEVRALSLTDPLTGLANRRQLERDLNREFAAAKRGRRLAAVLFDLDGFKAYNDRYGHLAGDEALRVFAEVLAAETRAMNLAARYGGDEFLSLLSDSESGGAQLFLERIQERFPAEVVKLGRGAITVSAGLAEYAPEMETPQELIAAADAALYQAKTERSSR